MSALTYAIEVNGDPNGTPLYGSQYDVAAGVTIYHGAAIFVNSSGYAVTLSPSQTMTCVGYNDGDDIDNSAGSNGSKKVRPRIGVIDMTNGTSSDAISADDAGKLAYASDNQTANLTSNSSTRPALGPIMGMNSSKVRVLVGFPANRSLQALEAVQPIDADLTAIAALSSTGLLSRTGSGTYSERTITAASARVTVTNGDGVSGNPTIEVPSGIIQISDPGTGQAIPVTASGYVGFTFNGSETNTLANPTFFGQRLILNADTATSGSRVVTAAARINQTGNTIMTFAAAGDCIVLEAIKIGGAFRWQVVSNDGVALS